MWMEAYPARLEDEPVNFVTDLGREAAFQQLKNKQKRGSSLKNKKQNCIAINKTKPKINSNDSEWLNGSSKSINLPD